MESEFCKLSRFQLSLRLLHLRRNLFFSRSDPPPLAPPPLAASSTNRKWMAEPLFVHWCFCFSFAPRLRWWCQPLRGRRRKRIWNWKNIMYRSFRSGKHVCRNIRLHLSLTNTDSVWELFLIKIFPTQEEFSYRVYLRAFKSFIFDSYLTLIWINLEKWYSFAGCILIQVSFTQNLTQTFPLVSSFLLNVQILHHFYIQTLIICIGGSKKLSMWH